MRRDANSTIIMLVVALVGFWLITSFYVTLPYAIRGVIGVVAAVWLAISGWREFRGGSQLSPGSPAGGKRVQYWRGQRIETEAPKRGFAPAKQAPGVYLALVYMVIGGLSALVIVLRLIG